jgi:hypothetical protein
MAASDGATEEAFLDRMLTRLALTEETQLEKVLSKLLPLAVSRLGSAHHPTKMKVRKAASLAPHVVPPPAVPLSRRRRRRRAVVACCVDVFIQST